MSVCVAYLIKNIFSNSSLFKCETSLNWTFSVSGYYDFYYLQPRHYHRVSPAHVCMMYVAAEHSGKIKQTTWTDSFLLIKPLITSLKEFEELRYPQVKFHWLMAISKSPPNRYLRRSVTFTGGPVIWEAFDYCLMNRYLP